MNKETHLFYCPNTIRFCLNEITIKLRRFLSLMAEVKSVFSCGKTNIPNTFSMFNIFETKKKYH